MGRPPPPQEMGIKGEGRGRKKKILPFHFCPPAEETSEKEGKGEETGEGCRRLPHHPPTYGKGRIIIISNVFSHSCAIANIRRFPSSPNLGRTKSEFLDFFFVLRACSVIYARLDIYFSLFWNRGENGAIKLIPSHATVATKHFSPGDRPPVSQTSGWASTKEIFIPERRRLPVLKISCERKELRGEREEKYSREVSFHVRRKGAKKEKLPLKP